MRVFGRTISIHLLFLNLIHLNLFETIMISAVSVTRIIDLNHESYQARARAARKDPTCGECVVNFKKATLSELPPSEVNLLEAAPLSVVVSMRQKQQQESSAALRQ
jgi:uncharacterized membrane protein